jgi:hypothetical protein
MCTNTYNLVRKNSVYFLGFQQFGIALDFQFFRPTRNGSLFQRRNPIYNMAYSLTSLNLIGSYLMGKFQDQSVRTYVFDSLSVLTLATTSIYRVAPLSDNF